MLLKSFKMFSFFLSKKSADLNMWLISWWVAWLMNFYGFSYKLQGMNIELHRYSMELHNIPYNSINTPRNSMEFHGTPRTIHGTAWHSMELYRYSKELHGFLWNFMEFYGFRRIPRRYFTRDASHKYCRPVIQTIPAVLGPVYMERGTPV